MPKIIVLFLEKLYSLIFRWPKPPFFMLKILVYTLISAFGWIVILFMDESEMFLYQNVPFLNLILVFYSLRIFIGISIIILPCKLLSYLNFVLLKKWTQRLLMPFLFIIPFIISPPDSWGFKHKKTSKEQKAHLENLLIQNNNIHSENSLICFLSVHCTFCKLAGKKLGVIKNNLAYDDQLQIVIHNDSSEVQSFFKIALNGFCIMFARTFNLPLCDIPIFTSLTPK